MSTKGDEQGKKITPNTVSLKSRVPGEGTEQSIQFCFVFAKKKQQKTKKKKTEKKRKEKRN